MRCYADDDDLTAAAVADLHCRVRRKHSSGRWHTINDHSDRAHDCSTSLGRWLARWRVTCRTRRRSVVTMNGWRSVAACRSAAIATPTSRTAPRPPPARPTGSTVWWCCTRRCAIRTPVPCPRTERSIRAPSARASSLDTTISQSLKRHYSVIINHNTLLYNDLFDFSIICDDNNDIINNDIYTTAHPKVVDN